MLIQYVTSFSKKYFDSYSLFCLCYSYLNKSTSPDLDEFTSRLESYTEVFRFLCYLQIVANLAISTWLIMGKRGWTIHVYTIHKISYHRPRCWEIRVILNVKVTKQSDSFTHSDYKGNVSLVQHQVSRDVIKCTNPVKVWHVIVLLCSYAQNNLDPV